MERSIVAMLSRTADGAMLADEQGTVALWNKAAERLLGFRAAEVIGRPCHEVMRGETLAGHPFCSSSCAVGQRLGCGSGVRNFDIRIHTKGGKVVWLNVSSLPVPSRKKGRFLFVHLFRDTGRQAKVRHLVNELHSALSVSDEHGAGGSQRPLSAALPLDPISAMAPTLPLSRREREVLQRLALGERTTRIAETLCVSPATVRNHIQHILEKLGVHSRLEALAVAFHHKTLSS